MSSGARTSGHAGAGDRATTAPAQSSRCSSSSPRRAERELSRNTAASTSPAAASNAGSNPASTSTSSIRVPTTPSTLASRSTPALARTRSRAWARASSRASHLCCSPSARLRRSSAARSAASPTRSRSTAASSLPVSSVRADSASYLVARYRLDSDRWRSARWPLRPSGLRAGASHRRTAPWPARRALSSPLTSPAGSAATPALGSPLRFDCRRRLLELGLGRRQPVGLRQEANGLGVGLRQLVGEGGRLRFEAGDQVSSAVAAMARSSERRRSPMSAVRPLPRASSPSAREISLGQVDAALGRQAGLQAALGKQDVGVQAGQRPFTCSSRLRSSDPVARRGRQPGLDARPAHARRGAAGRQPVRPRRRRAGGPPRPASRVAGAGGAPPAGGPAA